MMATVLAAAVRGMPDEHLAELVRALPDEQLVGLLRTAMADDGPPRPRPAARRVARPAAVKTRGNNGAAPPSARPKASTRRADSTDLVLEALTKRATRGATKGELEAELSLRGPQVNNALQRLRRSRRARLEGSRRHARWFPTT